MSARPRCLPGVTLLLALAGCTGGGGGGGGGSASTAAPVTSATTPTATAPVSSSTTSGATAAPPPRTAPANLATGPDLVLDASGTGDFYSIPWPLDSRRSASGGLDLSALADPLGK